MADTATRSDTAPATRLGAELQAARRNLGWELPQLASSLRIRQSYLEAIETGRIADLPGTTYALGFVRAYAAALGLPGEEMARRFRAEAEGVNGKPTLHFPAPVPRRGVPAGALMLLGLVILAGAYGGWYWVTEHRATPVETVPPIPDRLATTLPKPAPSPQVASILPSTAPPGASNTTPPPAPSQQAAQHPGVPHQITTTPPPGSSPASLPPAAMPAIASSATPAGGSPAAVSSAPAATAAGVPPAGGTAGSRLVITATADAWLTVKQPDGPPLLNKMFHAGDSWPVPADKPGLTLNTGNAGATIINVDGAPMPQSLGTPGMVRRDVPLDADLLKSGQLPPPKARVKVKPPVAPPA
jgi:cytoskeleton protein RodZ